MSQKVTEGDRTIWVCPRITSGSWAAAVLFWSAVMGGGIYGCIVGGGGVAIIPIVLGSILAGYSCRYVGYSHIVFDNGTQQIYIENKRYFFLRSTTCVLGPYYGFKERSLRTKITGNPNGKHQKHIQIRFRFSDGFKVNDIGDIYDCKHQEKADTVKDINSWWEAYRKSHSLESKPPLGNTEIVYQTDAPNQEAPPSYEEVTPALQLPLSPLSC